MVMSKQVFRLISCLFVVLQVVGCKPDVDQLSVEVEKIAMRAAPGIKSAEMVTLNRGDRVKDLGQVSPFESEISFDGTILRAPWLKVQKGEKSGWVFAGALKPNSDPADWMLQKRLECYFGRPFADRLNAWKASLDQLGDEQALAAAFREAVQLRNTMIEQLDRRANQDGRPEYFWLNEAMPGCIYQRAFRLGPPQLLFDYRFWADKARKTSGSADDDFMQLSMRAFSTDSIESMFPVWRFQLSEMDGASQLGTGAHLDMLKNVEQSLAKYRLFEPELLRFKEALLDDILNNNTKFWQSQELILQELDAILANPPAILQAREINALERRRTMLQDPEKNWVKVNLRSKGVEE